MTVTALKRELGVFGAVMMGLGSIVGTGVFVSVGIAAGVVGPAVVLATLIAAATATFNGLSSAQLAANHPVSGGTYEYGYRYLHPRAGFMAGWLFLLAKSASAATAALGFAGYLLNLAGITAQLWTVIIALMTCAALGVLLVGGLRRSNQVNIAIVSVTLASLAFFIVAGLPNVASSTLLTPFFQTGGVPAWRALLEASALMFVAYTGYGRIATLGEEVREPRRTIPRAIITTLVVVMTLYAVVALVAVSTLGTAELALTGTQVAPLERAAATFNIPFSPLIVAIGAMTAMLGVLLNLLLGLSRVLLAMGRRGDMPKGLGKLSADASPNRAIITMTVFVALLALIGNVTVTWSFSAFTVLAYYAITNAAALRLSKEERFFPAWVSVAGLICCAGLAFFVQPWVWSIGLGLIAVGFAWQVLFRSLQKEPLEPRV
jgi:APA family basic amino acid/polyamine antiporter